jgi:hypothetical protein
MSKKMGRPKLAANKAKGVLMAARFSREESRRVNEAAKRAKQTKSQWIRNAVLGAS